MTNFELLAKATVCETPAATLALCDQILVNDASHLPAIELKIKCHWRMGLYEAALQGLDQALSLNPYDPGYHFLKGDCYQNLLRYGDALESFRRCLRGDDADLADLAEIRMKGLEEWQRSLMEELLRSQPQLVAKFQNDTAELLRYGFRPCEAKMSETVMARLASPSMWARPS